MGPNIKIQKTGAEVTAKPNFWPASDLGVREMGAQAAEAEGGIVIV
jgi:hypothetical protein